MDGASTSGGSAQLAGLIDKHGELLVPDLKQHYGIDLRDLFSEDNPLSPRWVLMHVNSLPLASAFVADRRGGPEFRGWDEDRYMTAALINALRTLQYIFVLAHIDPKKSKPSPPEPYPLPDKPVQTKQVHKPGSFGFMALDLLGRSKKRKKGGG